jgi:CubicO group peptidase (beta-lactamase class C family)
MGVVKMPLVVLMFLLCLPTVAQSSAAALKDELQSNIEATLKVEKLTGIAWMLVSPDSGVATGQAGFVNAESQRPFSSNTRFHVGSVTKTVLSTGILRLVSEAKIDLDAPAKNYVSDLQLDNPWESSTPVTVRHLLDHTSGMEDAHFWQLFSERPTADVSLYNSLPDAPIEIQFQPGKRYSYSNMGYTILGLVIEEVTKLSYEEYLDQNLLRPLGMTDSTFEYTTQSGPEAVDKLAWGHLDLLTPYAAPPMFLRPAGQFTTTAKDLGRLAIFLMGDGSLADGTAFIGTQLLQERGRATSTDSFQYNLKASSGLGLARRDRHGVVGYCHTGSIIGFYAVFCIYPEERKAFAYSVNTDSETADYSKLTALLIKALKPAPAQMPVAEELPPNIDEWTGYYKISSVRFKLFEYIDTVFGLRQLSIDADGAGLDLTSFQAKTRHLVYSGKNLYRSTDRTTNSHVFYEDSNGVKVISDGFNSYERVNATFAFWHMGLLAFGLGGIACIFLVGVVTCAGGFKKIKENPVAPGFFGVVSLALPIPVFFTQSFMALGDLTLAGGLLAIVTGLFPLTMAWTLFKFYKNKTKAKLAWVVGCSATFTLAWWLDMAAFGQIPLMLWS